MTILHGAPVRQLAARIEAHRTERIRSEYAANRLLADKMHGRHVDYFTHAERMASRKAIEAGRRDAGHDPYNSPGSK